MLTKEERKAIADRLNYSNNTDYHSFYKAVTGHSTTTEITLDDDIDARTSSELSDIADQLEKLENSDD